LRRRNTSLVQMFQRLVRNLQGNKRRNKLLAKTIGRRPNLRIIKSRQLVGNKVNRLYKLEILYLFLRKV